MRILIIALAVLVFANIAFSAETKSDSAEFDKLVKKYEAQLENFTDEQVQLVREIVRLTKPYGISHTAVAIAWQESGLGRFPVNLADPSCGIYHKMVSIFLKGRNEKVDTFNKNRACSMLIQDLHLSTAVLIEDIEYWKNFHTKRGIKKVDMNEYIYRSYNAGYNVKNKKAKEYATSVRARVRVLLNYQVIKDELQIQLVQN